jgi:prepilin-type N-terminal cleavage/methylation domain-containing protein
MSGFTILETLVAVVIASVMLTALYGLFGRNIAAVDGADSDARAVLLAQSKMESVGASPLRTGTTHGQTDDGYAWTEDIRLDDGLPRDARPSLVPFAVTVTVSWRNDQGPRSVSLDSIRLGSTP